MAVALQVSPGRAADLVQQRKGAALEQLLKEGEDLGVSPKGQGALGRLGVVLALSRLARLEEETSGHLGNKLTYFRHTNVATCVRRCHKDSTLTRQDLVALHKIAGGSAVTHDDRPHVHYDPCCPMAVRPNA